MLLVRPSGSVRHHHATVRPNGTVGHHHATVRPSGSVRHHHATVRPSGTVRHHHAACNQMLSTCSRITLSWIPKNHQRVNRTLLDVVMCQCNPVYSRLLSEKFYLILPSESLISQMFHSI